MTEQEKRAKVIAEIERVADEANPWKESPPLRCDISYPLLIDALDLLKAHEPRVMTWDEVCAWWDIPVWERDPVFHEHINKRGSVCEWTNLRPCEEELYGVTDRCWTSRPTDEQREATPWQQD